jgi:hypothetical protein
MATSKNICEVQHLVKMCGHAICLLDCLNEFVAWQRSYLRPKRAIMQVIDRVARIAMGGPVDLCAILGKVANVTAEAAVSHSQRIPRLFIMIKEPPRPFALDCGRAYSSVPRRPS